MISTAGFRRKFRTRYTLEGQVFHGVSVFYYRACFAIRFFYVYSCVIAYQLLSRLDDVAHSQENIWLWPVAWLQYIPESLIRYLGSLVFFGFLFASMFPHRRDARVGAFILAFIAVAMVNSQGAINHGYHVWLWISFLFVFLPRLRESETNKAVMLSVLTVMVGVQASIALFYTLSGIWKVTFGVTALMSGEQGNFSFSGLANQLANRSFQTVGEPLLADFFITYPWIGAPGLWFLILVQFMSYAIIFAPMLHRAWGTLLILFHFGTWALMSISFPLHILWLLIFFVWSPFREPPNQRLRHAP